MRMFVVVALAVSASGGALAEEVPSRMTWSGEMRQIEVNTETTYPMTLTFARTIVTADYPTLNCSGTWTKVAESNGYLIYAEKVTNRQGATCIDGMAMVAIDQGKVFVGWFAAYAGEPSVATAVLLRAAK
ncbi:MAG: hypothetical protein ACKVRO_19235 [Micropepsaceae bacterium]